MSFSLQGKRLNEIQDYFEKELYNVNKIADIPLTYEDYLYLDAKMKILFEVGANSRMIIEYKPCVVVYWVFSMIYAEDKDKVTRTFDQLPQYLKKTYISLCLDVFGEHGLMKYRKKNQDITAEVRALIAIQAGLEQPETADIA